MTHIVHVVGARPNFMKVAPVETALAQRDGVRQTIVHTGQHYDAAMSSVFFEELGIPEPDLNLEVGSGSHAAQTGETMRRFEDVAIDLRPDLVLVYGDVNSTVAAALVCAKQLIPLGHVEAGLRSFDRTMPEEVNRVVTDRLADLLFTPSRDGDENLAAEGVAAEKIHMVGNVMIDTLVRLLPRTEESAVRTTLGLDGEFGLVTLHRPSNVDAAETLVPILEALDAVAEELPLVLPMHPRTRAKLDEWSITVDNVALIDPLGYLDFLALQRDATVVVTDSGGIQEETTYLGVPCLTMRENTERPVTVTVGTNKLLGTDADLLVEELRRIIAGERPLGDIPELWDGRSAERIADVICG